MKARKFLFAGLLGLTVAGCGEPTYDIPPVDEAETKKQEEQINKAMQEEMQKQMQGGGAG